MTHLWLPAFTQLARSLADEVASDELDISAIATQAHVRLATVPMPTHPLGRWEALIGASQGQDRLLELHAALAGRYSEWPRVRAEITGSLESVLSALAAEAGADPQASPATELLRDHVWREIGQDVPLNALATELARMQAIALAAAEPGADLELAAAAEAATAGDGQEVLSRLARGRHTAAALADKVGAPLVTELLKRLLLPD